MLLTTVFPIALAVVLPDLILIAVQNDVLMQLGRLEAQLQVFGGLLLLEQFESQVIVDVFLFDQLLA